MKAAWATGLMLFFTIIAAGGGFKAALATGICGGAIGAVWYFRHRQ